MTAGTRAVTHEPAKPLPGYPYSHVRLDDVFLDDCDECVKVTVHGCEHYLHRSALFCLYEQIQRYFKGVPGEEKMPMVMDGFLLGDELF